jgi:hypothetical protein
LFHDLVGDELPIDLAADVFYALPRERQAEAWDALADEAEREREEAGS